VFKTLYLLYYSIIYVLDNRIDRCVLTDTAFYFVDGLGVSRISLYQAFNFFRLFRRYRKEQMEAMQAEKDRIKAERAKNAKMLAELKVLKAYLERQATTAKKPANPDKPKEE